MLNLEERNVLIVNHINYANRLAIKQYAKTPRCVELDELKSAAYMGLVDAAKKYDGKRPFEVYAAYRIFGEIKDYLRSLRWSRSEEVKTTAIQADYDVADRAKTPKVQFDEILEELPEVNSNILKLYYRDDHTIKEVAKKVKLSPTRVHQLLKTSLSELKKCA
jgi:RNA polymerase sigma factor for flagellar operon FliA